MLAMHFKEVIVQFLLKHLTKFREYGWFGMTVYFVSANYKQAAKADLPGVINAYFSITFDKDRYFSQSSHCVTFT